MRAGARRAARPSLANLVDDYHPGRLIGDESQCAKEMNKGLTWRSLHRRKHFSLRGLYYDTQSVQNKCIVKEKLTGWLMPTPP